MSSPGPPAAAEKQLKSYRTQVRKTLKRTERRGTSARRKATTEARKTRNKVEREARKRQRTVETTLKRNRNEVESRVRRAIDEQTSRAQGLVDQVTDQFSRPCARPHAQFRGTQGRPFEGGFFIQRPVTKTGREVAGS